MTIEESTLNRSAGPHEAAAECSSGSEDHRQAQGVERSYVSLNGNI